MTEVIKVEGLIKQYDDVCAVNNINFTINQGHCFGLLGPNGAGKTTTIEMMEGLIAPSQGSILYYGRPLTKAVSHDIGIQFQQTALQDYLTVQETLNLFSALYEQPLCQKKLIELCHLGDFIDRHTRLLSGGQRQRLLLALALINDPSIIFLDEPTTGLDPQARHNFWQLIRNIKAQNKPIVLTTHYMDEAEQLCDEIVIMEQGKIIEEGVPDQLLTKYFSESFIYLPRAQVSEELIEAQNWHRVNDRIQLKTTNIEQTLAFLMASKVSLEGLSVKSANLDDLFLTLTGHSLKE